MGILHPATFKAPGHLLWLCAVSKLQNGDVRSVIQTDLATWPSKAVVQKLHMMRKKNEGIVMLNLRRGFYPIYEKLPGADIANSTGHTTTIYVFLHFISETKLMCKFFRYR